MLKVIISILNFNSGKDTINCLLSLKDLNLKNIEIVTYVLDNGSKKKFEIEEGNFKGIGLRVVRSDTNKGFTGGHNYIYELVKKTEFDYFLLLNNDCLVEKNSLVQLIEKGEEELMAVVPKIYFTKGHEYHKDRYQKKDLGKIIWYAGGEIDWKNVVSKHIGLDEVDKGQFDKKKEIDFATGACLLLPRKILERIGLFDERYFLYYEDADLSMRIIRGGYKIFYQPNAIVWHNNAGSSGSGSDLHDYYLTRNRLLFGMNYAPLRARLALFRESIRLLRSGRKWQKIGVKDYYLKRFGRGSYVPGE